MKGLICFVTCVLISTYAVALVLWVAYISPTPQLPVQLPEQPADIILIKKGDSFNQVLQSLRTRGWNFDAERTALWARITGIDAQIKSGEILREQCCSTVSELLTKMRRGGVVLHKVTLIEGKTFRDTIQTIHNHPHVKRTLTSSNPHTVAQEIGFDVDSLEGLIFPDTYKFESGTTDVAIIKRAYKAMQTLLEKYWPERQADLPYENSYEALVLASIVEAEARINSERSIIAGVYVNRLKTKTMTLDADPTVVYGLGSRFKAPLTFPQMRIDTPWNTYMHLGLPPTPINLVSEKSLKAALNPKQHDWYFFVAKPNGSHIFAETFSEHKRNICVVQPKRRGCR